jgi:short-chain fatty acids transporter
MMPKEEETVTVNPELLKDDKEEIESNTLYPNSFANRSETSIVITVVIGALGLAYLIWHFITNGFDLNLNIINMIFVILGIIFHGTPRKFLAAVNQAIKTTGGIVFQFPFYAGIMGMMTASGLATVISEGFISISNETTFPLLAFWSAGIVNIFVPSGGGQWAVQAPIMLDAATTLGVDYAKTAMAIAWGDAWTNMIQPFWALPALAIAGLKAKDIMGFCVFVLIFTGIIISLGLLIF